MAKVIEFDNDGNIVIEGRRLRAVVRFPTEKEQAEGITEVDRPTRVKEYVVNH